MTAVLTIDKAAIARQTARMMLEVEAIHFYKDKPFIFTSGWASPVYVDCRKLISFPRVRAQLMDYAVAVIGAEVGYASTDIVAGGETAGIPFAAWIAERMGLPMQYIRKKPKGFGRNAQIEGLVTLDARTLLVEDLASDGRSKLNFAKAIRDAGQQIDHCFVVFFYNIFANSLSDLKAEGLSMHYLATWWDVLEAAKESGHFPASTLDEVENFLHNPAPWSAAHGGISQFGQKE